ncbi:MAG TPA: ATP-binding protein [Terriglobia bacterium]|nr:ATP-binding protein [Terriglobia bacterium]
MRVSTKVICGLGILMLLAFAALGYQVSVINQMQSINQDLSAINFQSAFVMLNLVQLSKTITEFSQKYFISSDPAIYDRQLEEIRKEFGEGLDELRKTVRTNREHVAVEQLSHAIDDFWRVFNRIKGENQRKELDFPPPDLASATDHLEAQADVTSDAIKVSIREEVARAAAAGQRAQQLSRIAEFVALGVGILVWVSTVRAITLPLRRLTQGTRAVAKGQFWHRLPAHGRDEFAEVARDFNAMAARLGELDQMKKDFVSHVSHDLKAPLASIRQVMHVLLQEIPGALNEQQKSLLRLNYNSAERLAAMVGNLLDVSRMEAGTMEYVMAPHDLIPILNGVMEEFEVQAREKNVQLRLESDPSVFVECDRDRIVQVIGNLVDNALKFSPGNSQIVCRTSEGGDGSILVSVTDSGPGVPDEHKRKIFFKFHQVKQGKKMAGQGVGLGLAICKTIVEAHQGDIWVEDNPNGGSVFTFQLHPAAKEEVIKCGQSA